ncbi:proteasome subunit alpha type-3-like [Drosophila miranda]|uniref:proteasome subunit alpha type-3-like n=1 Tax=Drosophila miranda TaxID=7229 RepID=UPI0007E7AF91|nr:proteasome subunit alpha type-3-like [Drosophila miranda]
MYSEGLGFDLSTAQYAPNGRVLQIDYATRAAEKSGTVMGIRGKDSIVLAVQNLYISPLFDSDANKRIFAIDGTIGMAVGGLISDCNVVVELIRLEASSFRSRHERTISLEALCEHVDSFLHAQTMYSGARPFAVTVMLAGWDEEKGPRLYQIETSGTTTERYSSSFGEAGKRAQREMDKFRFNNFPSDQLMQMATEIIHNFDEEPNGKTFRWDVGTVGAQTKGLFKYNSQEWTKKNE